MTLAIANDDTPYPWERQPGEPPGAYQAFIRYRDLPPSQRSARRAGAHDGTIGTKAVKLATKHNWVARALAWDGEQDRLLRLALIEERVEMGRRQARIARVAMSKIVQWLMELDPSTLTPVSAARWLEVAVKVERLALGEPDRLSVTVDGDTTVIDRLTPEETLAALAETQRQIHAILHAHEVVTS